MSFVAVAFAGFLIAHAGPAGGTEISNFQPPCDPDIEPCCPLYVIHLTTNYPDWRACIPVEKLPVEGDHA